MIKEGLPPPPGNPNRMIFGPRPEPQPIVSPPFVNANNRIRQSPTAQQLLKNSAFLLTNITTCRKRIQQLQQTMLPYLSSIHQLRNFPQALIKSQLPQFARSIYRRPPTLNLFHRHLINMASIINLYSQFRISTPINTSIDISVKPARQSRQQLQQHIQTLKALHEALQQRLYEYEYDMSNQIEPPIAQLQQYMKIHQNDINILMNIEQLQLNNIFQNFNKYYQQNDMAYSRFKTIEDCIGAMDIQPKTMKNKINTMRQHFGNVYYHRYQDTIRATKALYQEMVRLEKLYQSNFQRMVREGSEATFQQYHDKLKYYQENKENFVNQVKKFRQLVKIFDRLTEIKKQSEEVGRRVMSHYQPVDIDKLKKLYSQTSTIQTNGSEVEKYKSSILLSMQKDLTKAGCNEISRPITMATVDPFNQTVTIINDFFNKLGMQKSSQFLMQTIRQQRSWLNQCRQKTYSQQSSATLKDLKIYLDVCVNLSQNIIYLHDKQYYTQQNPAIFNIIDRLFQFLSTHYELRGLPASLQMHLFQNLIDMLHVKLPKIKNNAQYQQYLTSIKHVRELHHVYSISDYNKAIKINILDSLFDVDPPKDELFQLASRGSINLDIFPKISEKINVKTGIQGIVQLKLLYKIVSLTPPSIKKKNYLVLLNHMRRLMQNAIISQKLLNQSEKYLQNLKQLRYFDLVLLVLQQQQQLQMTIMPNQQITDNVQKYATTLRKQYGIIVQFGASLSKIKKIVEATIAINEINSDYTEYRCRNMTLLHDRINKIAQCVQQPTEQDRIRFKDTVVAVKDLFGSNFHRYADWVAYVKALFHYKQKQFSDIPQDLFMKDAVQKVFNTKIAFQTRFPPQLF